MVAYRKSARIRHERPWHVGDLDQERPRRVDKTHRQTRFGESRVAEPAKTEFLSRRAENRVRGLGVKHAVWISSVADGRGVAIDPESPDQHSPAWSPDGKWIAYQRLSGTNWELVKVPSVAANLCGWQRPRRVAATRRLGRQQATGSRTYRGNITADFRRRPNTKNTERTAAGGIRFLSGRIVIVCGSAQRGREMGVSSRSMSGASGNASWPKLICRLGRPFSGFALHPNGMSFATGLGIARHDIWMLEGLKPPSRWFSRF